MDEEYKKIKRHKIRMALLLIFAVLVILSVSFVSFKISTDAHRAFREAKNIKLAFRMLEIEYYGQGKSIYNPTALDGMSDGVMRRINELLENDGEVFLTGFDKKNRKVTSFTYTIGFYQVRYQLRPSGKDDYVVSFVLPVYHYDGGEDDSQASGS